MAGKKKNWNEGTELRYLGKALRVQMGIIPDPEVAKQIAEAQTRAWRRGAGKYKDLRAIAGSIMDTNDAFVPAPFRAPYYAFVEEYYKEVVERKINPDDTYRYLLAKYNEVDEAKIRAILEAMASQVTEFGPLPSKRE